MTEQLLNELLKEYQENYTAMAKECASVDEQIANLQSYRKSLAAPWEEILQDLELKIRLPMFDRKASFVCGYGKITYFKGGVKRSWDLDAVDNICKLDEYVKHMIWAHRKESPFDARIQIKVEAVK